MANRVEQSTPLSVWQDKAEALGHVLAVEQLHPKTIDLLNKSAGKPWAIACSGGSDSLALLLLIWSHFPEQRNKLTVLHYNHKLRKAADNDAQFVKEITSSLNISYIEASSASTTTKPSEADLREERLAFFHQELKKLNTPILLLGHQQDDIAETLLMRIVRGSGLAGLCAPRAITKHKNNILHIRPLLMLRKDIIQSAFKKLGITWREDHTNHENHFFRNQIRNRILPVLEEVAPTDIYHQTAHCRELLEEDNDALEAWLDSLYKEWDTRTLSLTPLANKPKALYRRALYKWCLHHNLVLTAHSSEPILAAMLAYKTKGAWEVSKNIVIELKNQTLSFRNNQEEHPPILPAKTLNTNTSLSWNSHTLHAEWVTVDKALFDKICSGSFSPEREVYLQLNENNLPLTIRTWEPGDRYQPLGAPGSKKLQDAFIDNKITEKHTRPVICDTQGHILWCPGLPPDEKLRLKPNDVKALRLTYLPI